MKIRNLLVLSKSGDILGSTVDPFAFFDWTEPRFGEDYDIEQGAYLMHLEQVQIDYIWRDIRRRFPGADSLAEALGTSQGIFWPEPFPDTLQ